MKNGTKKKALTSFIAVLLAVIMAVMNPAKALASNTAETVYLSEIRVGMGKSSSEAENALEGYTIITDDKGNKVDFNSNAGGGLGSKGEKVVYIGFKTTTNRKDAITDIALMNMKGSYSIDDYDTLMKDYINDQIIPFVDGFYAAIKEYRENYNSSFPANKARADYVHDLLNKITDDDCGGAALGDLLLNKTKYEMFDEDYNALSDEEKKQHLDIVTLFAQANGRAVLIIENLLTRAADTNKNTWIDRFTEKTYEDLLEDTGLSLSTAKKELDKLYYDDSMKILDMWDVLREQLLGADQDQEYLDNMEAQDNSEVEEKIRAAENNCTEKTLSDAYAAAVENANETLEIYDKLCNVAARDFLSAVEYGDGTLYDFFTQTAEDVESDITVLYPLTKALSNGQKAGLEFVSLRELVLIGGTDEKGYKNQAADSFAGGSVYEGVDRGIYQKGGVGMTTDARRSGKSPAEDDSSGSLFHWYTYAMMGLAGAAAIGCITTFVVNRIVNVSKINFWTDYMNRVFTSGTVDNDFYMMGLENIWLKNQNELNIAKSEWVANAAAEDKALTESAISYFQGRSSMCKWLGTGLGIAMIIITAITVYLSYRDMVNHYKVEFTPIPRYMVDEKDITAFNEYGEKILIRNQAAYYKAALCNRKSSDEYYNIVGDVADLNGDVGKQWLAIYYAKNEAEMPVLANSLKVVTGNSQIPANYSKGVHMFGVGATENINNTLYVWNSSARSIYLYYQLDTKSASLAGSGFSAGTVALSGGAGLAVGALASGLFLRASGKNRRKEEETEAA